MYIGERKVEKIEGCLVTFVDGGQREYTHKQLSYIVTKKKKDATAYMELVRDNVMELIWDCILDDDAPKKILYIFEEHDLSNAEIAVLMQLLPNRLSKEYSQYLDETIGEEKKKYEANMKKVAENAKIISDSYTIALHTAFSKAIGTYEDGKHPDSCIDDVRLSNIKKFI